jgi:hypothetical protein
MSKFLRWFKLDGVLIYSFDNNSLGDISIDNVKDLQKYVA